MEELIVIKAKLRLKTSAEGGRLSGIKNGYRPNHVFDTVSKQTFIGEIRFEKEWILLGDEEDVTVSFIPTETIKPYLKIDQKWYLYEGTRLIGEALITEI